MIQLLESQCGTQAAADADAPLTEPEIIPCLFLTGTAVEIADGVVRITGWVQTACGGDMTERRVVTRIVLSDHQARHLMTKLRSGMARGGH